METAAYTRIRDELTQMRFEPPKPARKSPVFDFGVFLLFYFGALAAVATAMLIVNVPIQKYTVLYALPPAWLLLAWYRKAPLYALPVAVAGALFLYGCSQFAAGFFDVSWDGNSIHKPIAGLLANGWNPFRQTLDAFANGTDFLPYNPNWAEFQIDMQPKAAHLIAAAFYAFTGSIEAGKLFNLAGMAACVCILAPMIRDTVRIHFSVALLISALVCANPIALAQVLTFYTDGFTFQLLTVTASALLYAALRPEGRFALPARAAAFAALCLAVNTAQMAVWLCAMYCLVYYLVRVVAIAQTGAPVPERRRQRKRLLIFLAAAAVCALVVLGAGTYGVNLVRHGNPFYGMPGGGPGDQKLNAWMSIPVQNLSKAGQFFASLFAPASTGLFERVSLKVPFSFGAQEWSLSALDTNVGGWGPFFSGIFLLSVAVIFTAAYRLAKRRTRRGKYLVMIVFIVILPVFLLPYLYSARYYQQPFWLALGALVCLFAPAEENSARPQPVREANSVPVRLLGVALCLLLVLNNVSAYNYLDFQSTQTEAARRAMRTVQTETLSRSKVADVATASRGMFYGLFFNLRDEGITNYNFSQSLTDTQGSIFYYLPYNLRPRGSEARAEANSFLYALNANGYLVVIAKQGASGAFDSRMLALLSAMALETGKHDPAADNYLAVIDTNAHIRLEASGPLALAQTVIADGLTVQVQSRANAASIQINGVEYAVQGGGYNIVVFDVKNMTAVDSVVINTGAVPVLYR